MGCNKSKLRVVPQQTVEAWAATDGAKKPWKRSLKRQRGSSKLAKIQPRKNLKGDTIPKRPNIILVRESTNCSDEGSFSRYQAARESSSGSRITTQIRSANSTITKSSAQSSDSGLGHEYSHIITEVSPMAEREIAELPAGLAIPDLTLNGRKLRTPPNSTHRRRLPPIKKETEKPVVMPKFAISGPSAVQKSIARANLLINDLPDSPNIIKRPISRGGMAFDIVMDDTSSEAAPKKRPIHLQKLEKKQEPVTLRDLVEKQRDATTRREGHEQMRLERIRAQKEKERQVSEALAQFEAMKKEIKAEVENKMRTTSENREAQLKTLCGRLKEKSDKVEEVKNAKRIRKLPPLRHLSDRKHSFEERPVNLGAN